MSSTSAENRLDPSSPQFDPAICRDYVRNACRRGQRCKFKHPPQGECDKIRRSERIFCHDYQNSTCRRSVCKFLHYTREEEGIFRLTGRLPGIADREPSTKAKNILPSSLEQTPTCKDYINGICSRGAKCKYRHINANGERPDPLTSVLSWRDTLLGETECPLSLNSTLVSNEPSPPTFVTVVPNSIKSETSLPIQASISSIPQGLIPSRQPTILNAAGVIVSASDSLLLKDVYVTNTTQASQPTVVGMVDHVTLSAQPSTLHHQHTIYAHAPTLTSFAHPLASVTNPVLAVVAESTAPTGPGQHPTAVLQTGPPTATYHILSTNTSTCNTSSGSLQPQHHLLPAGSSTASCPTVFTIPLTQFACEAPATSATVLHHHHPQAVPATVFSSGPQVSYPSYGIVQPDTSMNTNCTVTTMASCHTVMYPSSSESLMNCSAPAAVSATNFLSRPGIAAATENCPQPLIVPSNSESSTSTGGGHHHHYHHHELQLQQQPSSSITNRSSTMAVAASLPAVSVAAAAAVAAATAIARSSNISAAAVRAGRTAVVAKHRKLKQPHITDCNSSTSSSHSMVDNSGNGGMVTASEVTADGSSLLPANGKVQRVNAYSDWKSTAAGASSTTTTAMATDVSTTTTTASPMLVKMAEDDVVEEDEGVGTETAAAFAAAACIGAMLSNPISSCASNTTSVAAMLGDLISGGHSNQLFSSDLKMPIPATSVAPTVHSIGGGLTIANDTGSPSDARTNSSGGVSAFTPSDCEPADCHRMKRKPASNECAFPQYRYINYQETGIHEEDGDSTDWSDVPTSVASAVKAAAAAAVAATAAVTNSATGFFRRTIHDAKLRQAVTTSSQVTGSLKGLLSSTRLSNVSSSSSALSPPTSAALLSSLWKQAAPRSCGLMTSTSSGSPNSSFSSPPASPSVTAVTGDEICDDIHTGSADGRVSNSGLSGLSPNTAATMTGAATAMAMVAAAATAAAAAKQRRFLSEPDSPIANNSQYHGASISQQSSYTREDVDYPGSGSTTAISFSRTPSSKRRRRGVCNRRYDFSCFGGQPCLRGSLANHDEDYDDEDDEGEEEDEEEEEDGFDEDEVDFPSGPAPSTPPPVSSASCYQKKWAKCSDQRIGQYRAGSCETSPSEGLSEVEPWSYRERVTSVQPLTLTNTLETKFSHKPGAKSTDVSFPSEHSRSVGPPLQSAAGRLPTHIDINNAKLRQKVFSSTRRAKSMGSLREGQHKMCSKTSFFPSKSLPNLAILSSAGYSTSSGSSSTAKTSQAQKRLTQNSLPPAVSNTTPSRSMPKSAETKVLSGSTGSSGLSPHHTYPHFNKLSRQCVPGSEEHVSSHSSTKRLNSFSQKRLINCFMQKRGRYKKARTSPANSMAGDASGTDDYCDDVYTEYYEDEFDSPSSRQRLRKRSLARDGGSKPPRLSSFGEIKQNRHNRSLAADSCSRVSEAEFHCSSATMRQQARVLRSENARLRQKVCELFRQRGDLRAANEVLLEQNARLRRSSKRASVVARMAESATKIIEAHNKATASQKIQQQQQQAQPFHHPQQAAPNSVSLTQAAAAAAAAVAAAHHHHQQQQNQSPAIPPSSLASTSCVYATSPPTAASQASANCVSSSVIQPGRQTAAVVSGATITIAPQHGSLATVQMQTPQTLTRGAETGHAEINFYSHQVSHPLTPIPVSIATSVALNPALSNMSVAGVDSPAAIQVCHYPVASNSAAAAVFPNLSQTTGQLIGSLGSPTVGVSAASAAGAPVAATATPRNAAVTFVLGQSAPTAFSPTTLHLSAEGVSGAATAPPYPYSHAYASLAQAMPHHTSATSLLQPCKLEPVGVNTSLGSVPATATVMRLLPKQHAVVPSTHAIADQRRG